MQRRKLLVALGSVAAGGAATVGTGAFSSTEASRNLSVSVAGDSSAYLGLSESAGDNAQFAEVDPTNTNSQLEIDFAASGNGGTGVNPDSTTVFESVFTVENQGTQPVQLLLSGDGTGDNPLIVAEPGSIDDGNPAPDQGDEKNNPGTPISLSGSDEVVAGFASVPAGFTQDGDGNIELGEGSSVDVDFVVATDDADTSFNAPNLTINAEDADDN